MEIEHRDRPRFLIFGRCRRNSATPFFCVVLVAGGDGSRHLRDLATWRAYWPSPSRLSALGGRDEGVGQNWRAPGHLLSTDISSRTSRPKRVTSLTPRRWATTSKKPNMWGEPTL